MKKYTILISIFIFFALIICVNKNVNADGVVVDEPEFTVPVQITWIDYDNYLKQRPETLTLVVSELKASSSDEYMYIPLKASDCKIERIDDTMSVWKGKIKLPKIYKGYYGEYGFVGNAIKLGAYDEVNNSGIASYDRTDGGNLSLTFFANLSREYKVIVNLDDDNNRDLRRPQKLYFNIKDNRGNTREVTCGVPETGNQVVEPIILDTYLYDNNDVPVWNEKIEYTAELLRNVIEQNMNTRQDLLDYYEDDIQVNDDQIIVNLKHTPEKYKLDSPIKVTWKDETAENRPDVIPVTLKSKSSNKVYATIELKKENNWEYTLDDLYVFERGSFITYNLEVGNVKDYDFEVIPTYNQYVKKQVTDFELVATYNPKPEEVEEPTEPKEPSDTTDQVESTEPAQTPTTTTENEQTDENKNILKNPITGDNIIIWIGAFAITVVMGTFFLTRTSNHGKHNKKS